ncbi:MAG: UDP-N-acetylmuramoylalanyl-D-glutamate--2,6-diaminopimelate ligase [Bdellovibrio sp. CG12_big_fil_rev_8_21_14_0_65_39_13]|nr:MAG: UDP-N-acetylmuramoylalanyl-D-glutamate--2,6-diaminopimelate ligase [Bdellovibrio sp. CG22_combo_CG10-13_8_21_14_all_39_27]PIQ60798.1 MAG: UDP-N-acetylmuramoylalanyl-D-glutamate--2,6-diaminopimelate ligase [Bdellovibrio sp. CG12_big_fil_rev_8_21_14_0_65_39_13]PIR36421.1 MAG: UDP-N-acetylmuramoylalanyl-D-glutamate--2,6-diaminopimelate ligase [Bdellovibrio sp. CG11_big_fil_rev_8_21_14_0_20_39_38]
MNDKKKLLKWFTSEQIDEILVSVHQLTTIAENASVDAIVFYKLTSPTSVELFKNRITNSKAHFYIISCDFEVALVENSIVVNQKEFEEIQKIFVRLIYPLHEEVKLIGVTGTNGKTSVVNYCAHLLSLINIPALCIGTMGISNGKEVIVEDAINTTPSYVDLMGLVFKFQDQYKYFFFEFSSHALFQKRLLDIPLDMAAWTSFSQDHLDFHKTMEAYFEAKLIIFDHLKNTKAKVVLPKNDDFSYKIIENSKYKEKVIFTKSLDIEKSKVHFVFHQGFNKSNLEISLMVLAQLGLDKIYDLDLSGLMPPSGRFEIVKNANRYAVIDYAHTPDALEKLLGSVQKTFPDSKITLVFGCGGNRDAKKRPIMGHIAQRFAHKVIITNDNPRNEAPEQISQDILSGITDLNHVEVVLDRKLAIEQALSQQSEKIVVVVAGKGHETYQEINGQRSDFSDKQVIENFYFCSPQK